MRNNFYLQINVASGVGYTKNGWSMPHTSQSYLQCLCVGRYRSIKAHTKVHNYLHVVCYRFVYSICCNLRYLPTCTCNIRGQDWSLLTIQYHTNTIRVCMNQNIFKKLNLCSGILMSSIWKGMTRHHLTTELKIIGDYTNMRISHKDPKIQRRKRLTHLEMKSMAIRDSTPSSISRLMRGLGDDVPSSLMSVIALSSYSL